MELNKIIQVYSSNYINSDELLYLQIVEKVQLWSQSDDFEKQTIRKNYLQMIEIHFSFQESLNYERIVIELTDKFLDFLCLTEYKFDDYSVNEVRFLFFRIRNLIYCEKELLFMKERVSSIKMHIPVFILEPLIEQVKDTEEYKKYKLGELLETYKKMYSLFLEKPYE